MFQRLRRVNWAYVIVKAVVLMFMAGAAGISFGHIVDVSHTLGLTWESYTVPFFVDGLAVLGLIGRTDKFVASTQRAGLILVVIAGSLSLACNVMAGDNLGQRLYGALVVAGFALAEWYAGRLKGAPPAPAEDTSSKLAARAWVVTEAEKAARKRAGYDKMTPADKARWTSKYRERASRRTPVSGAGVGPTDLPVPSLDELEDAVA